MVKGCVLRAQLVRRDYNLALESQIIVPEHDLEFLFHAYLFVGLGLLFVNYILFILYFGFLNQIVLSLFRIHSHTIQNRYLSKGKIP